MVSNLLSYLLQCLSKKIENIYILAMLIYQLLKSEYPFCSKISSIYKMRKCYYEWKDGKFITHQITKTIRNKWNILLKFKTEGRAQQYWRQLCKKWRGYSITCFPISLRMISAGLSQSLKVKFLIKAFCSTGSCLINHN